MLDRELNRIYKEIMNKLDKYQQEALNKAQINLIKYRYAEYKAISLIIQWLEGTMLLPVPETRRHKIIRQRAKELQDYLEWTKLYSPSNK